MKSAASKRHRRPTSPYLRRRPRTVEEAEAESRRRGSDTAADVRGPGERTDNRSFPDDV